MWSLKHGTNYLPTKQKQMMDMEDTPAIGDGGVGWIGSLGLAEENMHL